MSIYNNENNLKRTVSGLIKGIQENGASFRTFLIVSTKGENDDNNSIECVAFDDENQKDFRKILRKTVKYNNFIIHVHEQLYRIQIKEKIYYGFVINCSQIDDYCPFAEYFGLKLRGVSVFFDNEIDRKNYIEYFEKMADKKKAKLKEEFDKIAPGVAGATLYSFTNRD